MKFARINFPSNKYLIFACKNENALSLLHETYENDSLTIFNPRLIANEVVTDKTLKKFWQENIDDIFLGYWSRNGIAVLTPSLDLFEDLQAYKDTDIIAIEYKGK